MTNRCGGFYTLEALRGGLKDQYAVRRSYGTIVIELRLENDRSVVYEIISKPDGTVSSTAKAFTKLGEAHREFTRLTRKHP